MSYIGRGFWVVALLVLMVGCKKNRNEEGALVARVGSAMLFNHDIDIQYLSAEDSAQKSMAYIQDWIKEQVILQKASYELSDESREEIEDKVLRFRNSMVINNYENNVLAKYNDTMVQASDIKAFYDQYADQFKLKTSLIKARLVRIEAKTQGQDIINKYLGSSNTDDLVELNNYCLKNAYSIYLEDTVWMSTNDLFDQMPPNVYANIDFTQYNKVLSISDSLSNYYLLVRDFKSKGTASPLKFEYNNIKNILVMQRKQQYLAKFYQDLMVDAEKGKDFEIIKKK